ncbi:MAG TPA: TetR/AcrR family transcriptional regulator [Acidimicrobiales bacterium]|nr:TetR/AcrR family transcriptional regulator [Acidimicrobiales bacterium]
MTSAPQPAEHASGGAAGSQRKQELLESTYEYVLHNGLAGLSLRPLAKAIGSSPRVLLFLFGTKDALVQAILARAREDELAAVAELRDEREHGQLTTAAKKIWAWLVAPEHRSLLVLWAEGYTRSLQPAPGPWAGFARRTVDDWLDLLARYQPPGRTRTKTADLQRTLLLAVLRGLLLDLLATGDAERTTRAVQYFLAN